MTLIRGLDNQGDWLFGHGISDYRSKNDGIGNIIGLRILTEVLTGGQDWEAKTN